MKKMKDKLWVYVAGPYSKGDIAINIRNALSAAEELFEFKFIPIVPHLSHFWHLIFPHRYLFWLNYDIEIIKKCDILLRIDGTSAGADKEVEFAKANNIPVYFSITELLMKEVKKQGDLYG